MAAAVSGGRRESGLYSGSPPVATFLLLLLLRTAAGLVKYQGDQEVEVGKPFQLECKADGSAEHVYWTVDNHRVQAERGYSWQVDQKNGSTVSRLWVQAAGPEHDGEYRCYALSRDFRRLRVGSRPPLDSNAEEGERIAIPGRKLVLDCDLGPDSHAFKIRWEKDGGLPDRNRTEKKGRQLIIRKAEAADGGEYACWQEPQEGGRKGAYLGRIFSVYSAPQLRPIPPALSFLNGTKLLLDCRLSGGFPRANLTWLIGNEAAERRAGFDRRLLVVPSDDWTSSSLVVDRADYSDANRYTCQAENRLGRTETSVLVTVRDKIIKTNEEKQGKGLILSPGKQLVLQCETTVCANCTVEWLKDGDHINKSDDRIRVYDTNNTLIVSSAKAADIGDYMCFINKTVIGELINATITVRPKTLVEPFEKSINLVQGDPLNLHCKVKSGLPLPTIVWFRDGQLLNGSDGHISFAEDDKGIPNAILVINELEFSDRAHYRCEADNGISSSNTTILVRVKDKLAALWPFLGICAEVVILCTIIFIYEKKKVKEVEETEADQITESRNIPDRGRSQEVRQRK